MYNTSDLDIDQITFGDGFIKAPVSTQTLSSVTFTHYRLVGNQFMHWAHVNQLQPKAFSPLY